jgi:hypothetical protein
MFIDGLLIGVVLCGLVMSVIYLRLELLGSRRQKTASHAVHKLVACKREIADAERDTKIGRNREAHRKVGAGTQRRRTRKTGSVPAPREEGHRESDVIGEA